MSESRGYRCVTASCRYILERQESLAQSLDSFDAEYPRQVFLEDAHKAFSHAIALGLAYVGWRVFDAARKAIDR